MRLYPSVCLLCLAFLVKCDHDKIHDSTHEALVDTKEDHHDHEDEHVGHDHSEHHDHLDHEHTNHKLLHEDDEYNAAGDYVTWLAATGNIDKEIDVSGHEKHGEIQKWKWREEGWKINCHVDPNQIYAS